MKTKMKSLWTEAEHLEILRASRGDYVLAASLYEQTGRGKVSRQLARYWSLTMLANAPAKQVREMVSGRSFITPQPDDDIGELGFIKDKHDSILVIPDLHAPYQHKDALDFLRFVKAGIQPDLVVSLGDEVDNHALSFHDSDPDLHAAGQELECAKEFLHELHELFPEMLLCHSNHGSMVYRRSKAHGIPIHYIKKYRDILFPEHGAPGWSWRYGWRINTDFGPVMFKHQASGDVVQDAAHNVCSMVVGHQHAEYSIRYAASSAHLYYGAISGSLVDRASMAFAYGRDMRSKPVLGCMMIEKGRPFLLPMLLDSSGNWIRET